MLGNIKLGAGLENSQDEPLGEVKYLVADPKSKQVTHLVVEKGLFGLSQKVLEAGLVSQVSPDGKLVRVNLSKAQLESLPDFVEHYYGRAGEGEGYPDTGPTTSLRYLDSGYLYPVAGNPLMPLSLVSGVAEEYVSELNVPKNSLLIKAGVEVVATDGKLGPIKKVNINPANNQIESFVIEKGFFLSEEYTVPVSLVASAGQNWVRLSISKQTLKQWPYNPQPQERDVTNP
jgi:uncharacterized protein YrrD